METKNYPVENSCSRFWPKQFKTKMKLKLQDKVIEWSTHAKYLGIILNQKLNMNQHIKNTVKKARCARAALYHILNRNSALLLATIITILKIYIKSIIFYAAPTWSQK